MKKMFSRHCCDITASLWVTLAITVFAPQVCTAVKITAPNHRLKAGWQSSTKFHGIFIYSQVAKDASGKSNEQDGSDLFCYSIPGGPPRCILNHAKSPIRGTIVNIAVAPKGDMIALIANEDHHPVNEKSFSMTAWLLPANDSKPEKIKLDGDAQSFQWSPDGSSLGIFVGTEDNNRLWIIDRSHKTAKPSNVLHASAWTWTYDSLNVLYVNNKSQLVMQSPYASKPLTTWRLPNAGLYPLSTAAYHALGADEHHIYQFSGKGRKLLFNPVAGIVSEQVAPAPASGRIAVQTTLPEIPDPDQSPPIPISTDREIDILSLTSKRLKVPMHWSSSPGIGPTTYHIVSWNKSGSELLILSDVYQERASREPLEFVELYVLNASQKFKETPRREPVLGSPIFRSEGKVTSFDWQGSKR